ncbi:MAG: acyl carrier protein [Actinobacteria bacterium]|nr:acyl carrier protein [Actinomycetota bacterium]
MASVHDEVRQFVIDNFLFGQADGGFSDDISFIESGIIDSTGVLELIGFLEERYQFQLAPTELVPENLDSVNNLARLIARKRKASEQAQQKEEYGVCR